MKIINMSSLLFLSLIMIQVNADATSTGAVFGPSSGFVVGPVADNSTSLNNIIAAYNVTDKSSIDNTIQKEVLSAVGNNANFSCKYNATVIKEMNLAAGADRLELLQTSISMLDNPNMAKPILDPSQSASAGMIVASETLNASLLTANESETSVRERAYVKLCNKLNINSKGQSDQKQLDSYVCIAHQIMNNITSLFIDSDTLFQKATEMDTIVNNAMSEQTTRNANIQTQENKITEVNKELTKALDKLKKAKEAQKKAESSLASAQALAAAAPDDADAVAAAALAVSSAQSTFDKAQIAVNDASKELLEFLKTKMNYEIRTILALLSGTMHGDANGEDVHFKVSGNDFTLIDTDKELSSMLGMQGKEPHWGAYKLENPNASEADYQAKYSEYYTGVYFSRAAQNMSNNDKADAKFYSLLGSELTVSQNENMQSGLGRPAEDEKATSAILDKFYSMGGVSGSDNIETIAKALADYQSNEKGKKQASLEAMKTPEARALFSAQVLDKTNELNQNIRTMIVNNICYLDSIIDAFKKTRDQTSTSTQSDAHFKYLYEFKTAVYKKRLDEGYKSSVNVESILKDFDNAILKKFAIN